MNHKRRYDSNPACILPTIGVPFLALTQRFIKNKCFLDERHFVRYQCAILGVISGTRLDQKKSFRRRLSLWLAVGNLLGNYLRLLPFAIFTPAIPYPQSAPDAAYYINRERDEAVVTPNRA